MITFGTHYLLRMQASERTRVRVFYQDILGCTLESHDHHVTTNIPTNLDLFHFPDGVVLGVQYVTQGEAVLTPEQHRLACWMEVKTTDVDDVIRKLKAFGVTQITDFWDSEHFYFQAPGGQVFRIIAGESGT